MPRDTLKGIIGKDILSRMYIDERKSIKQIADIFGVSKNAINYWLTNLCIKKRNYGRMIEDKEESIRTRIIPRESGCWEWIGSRVDGGYGVISHNNRTFLAHRVSYETFVGEIPEGLVIDHKCRNRHCVNPDHLEAVTDRENILRGIGVSAINIKKTCCKNGHTLDGDNLYLYRRNGRNKRECRICRNEAVRRNVAKREVQFA